jgi:long-chain fatty acid transport protein
MFYKQKTISWVIASVLLGMVAGNASASGFALIEQSGSGLGNAFAGGAASAEDASTIFFNPAGMSRLQGQQISVAGNLIRPSTQFSGTATGLTPLQTAGTNLGGDGGSLVLIPNAYWMTEINAQTRVGVGINAPFGLQTNYSPTWMGRFQAIDSKLQTVNLNPSLAYQVNDRLSVGAGLNYQQVTGNLSSTVNYSAAAFAAGGAGALAAVGGANKEGISSLTGSDSAWGYNFGALFNLSSNTRIGMAYRSKIKYTLSGSVSFSGRPAALAAAIPDGAVSLAITMPDSFSMSALHQVNEQWEIMADATWTGWSVFKELRVQRANGAVLSLTPENWRDTWRISAGTTYHYNAQWLARAGVAFDQSPVVDPYRTVRIPDADRTWLSFGGQYKPSKNSAVDFGYAHLFVSGAAFNQTALLNADLIGKGFLTGSSNNSVDILSVQYSHGF